MNKESSPYATNAEATVVVIPTPPVVHLEVWSPNARTESSCKTSSCSSCIDALCSEDSDTVHYERCSRVKGDAWHIHGWFWIVTCFFPVIFLGIYPLLAAVNGTTLYQRESSSSSVRISLGSHLFKDYHGEPFSWLEIRDCHGSVPTQSSTCGSSKKSCRKNNWDACPLVNVSSNPFRNCPLLQSRAKTFARWYFASGLFWISQPVYLALTLIISYCCFRPAMSKLLSYVIFLPLDLLLGAVFFAGNIAWYVVLGNTPCPGWETYSGRSAEGVSRNGPAILSEGNGVKVGNLSNIIFQCGGLILVLVGTVVVVCTCVCLRSRSTRR